MITFLKLSLKNFISVGDIPVEIDLDSTATTLVIGRNGEGKSSSLLDGLSYALFGKAHRPINKPALINSINNKNCLVEVDFRIGEIFYKIRRGMRPNIFEIFQDGKLLNQESNSRDYQQVLETNILKLNHKSFHQVVVLGSSNYTPFMQLSAYQRRGVIEDLLDISLFTKMNLLLKESVGKQKDQIKDTEHSLQMVNEKIRLQTKHLDTLKSLNEKNNANLSEEISELELSVDQLIEKNNELQKEYDEKYRRIKKVADSRQNEMFKLQGFRHSIENKIETIVDTAKFYSENDVCPTCKQGLTAETKETQLHTCRNNAAELQEGYEKLKQSISETGSLLDEAVRQVSELNKIPNLIASHNHSITDKNRRIASLQKQRDSKTDSKEISSVQKQIESLRETKNNLAELRLLQIEDNTYNDVIAELLKDTGIKTKIIKQYLPLMNKLINQYLQTLDFFVSFHLDETFSETIKSRHRDDFTYGSFSEGEKARIDLSLLFAWRQIARMKNSANTNLLILDEILDGSTDAEGIEGLMQIISSQDPSTRTFIISHKQEYSESKFDRCLKFEKVNNFTRCVEIDRAS